MANPKAYAPEYGYMFQLLVRTPYDKAYEHCDYAVDRADKEYLLEEYRLAYGAGTNIKAVRLPRKYWAKEVGAL